MQAPFFWTYIAGPVGALLPKRWRRVFPAADRLHWAHAGALSGLLELAGAIFAMAYWYMLAMTPMISSAGEWALLGKFGREVSEFQVGGVALAVFATHPITWLFAYAFLEGALRFFGAAFTEDVLGTFPLYLLERISFLITHWHHLRSDEELQGHVSSMVGGVRAHVIATRLDKVPDELQYSKDASDEILEISASRPKKDWDPPKVVRVDETYYRLESSSLDKGSRPFRYRLRRLEAGVPGRNVLVYKTRAAPVKPE